MKKLASKMFQDWQPMLEFINGVVKRSGSVLTDDQGAGPNFSVADTEADFSATPVVAVGDLFIRLAGDGTKSASFVAELPEDTTLLYLASDLSAEEGDGYIVKSPPIDQADIMDVREEGRGCYHLFYFRDDGVTLVE